jgi:branched-chain amino acid transport system ATP-binding protein
MTGPGTGLLEAERLSVTFGGVAAVQDVTFRILPRRITGLIGPNGAGKTTTINAMTGFVRPTAGRVLFGGDDITGMRPERIAALGLIRTFQSAATFASMSVADNLATGHFLVEKAGFWQSLLRTGAFARDRRETRARVDRVLALTGLERRRGATARDLPYGEQRVLGVGIALMTDPKLLVLDEPAAGLSPDEARTMARLIRAINAEGVTILLIEHNMSVVMSVSDLVVVLKQGRKLAEGAPDTIRRHPEVVEAYLGAGP